MPSSIQVVSFSSQSWGSRLQFNTGYLCVCVFMREKDWERLRKREGKYSIANGLISVGPLTPPSSRFRPSIPWQWASCLSPQVAFRKIFHTDLWGHASESNTKAGIKQARGCFWLWCGMQDRRWIMHSWLGHVVFHHPLLFHHPNPLFFWWSELLRHSKLIGPVYRVLVYYVKKFGELSRKSGRWYYRFKTAYTFHRNVRWDGARQFGEKQIP